CGAKSSLSGVFADQHKPTPSIPSIPKIPSRACSTQRLAESGLFANTRAACTPAWVRYTRCGMRALWCAATVNTENTKNTKNTGFLFGAAQKAV
ncbi:MAG: hypothetical protein IJC27_07435, partial [Lentisphaeria bacterium]|nr:hypothetical protein [Lentisphaeria bacterium]